MSELVGLGLCDNREISDDAALHDNPDQRVKKILLQQWREIEEMLLERGSN
jgi:hypothetical protein